MAAGRQTTRYAPTPPPRAGTPDEVARWMHNELTRLAASMEAHEPTTINYGKEVRNVSTGGTCAIDWKAGNKQRVELGGDTTFVFAPPHGVCNFVLRLVQDDVGGHDVTFPAESCKWCGGALPTFTTSANAVDVLTGYYDREFYYLSAMPDSRTAA